jgi:hypothetical protein
VSTIEGDVESRKVKEWIDNDATCLRERHVYYLARLPPNAAVRVRSTYKPGCFIHASNNEPLRATTAVLSR